MAHNCNHFSIVNIALALYGFSAETDLSNNGDSILLRLLNFGSNLDRAELYLIGGFRMHDLKQPIMYTLATHT